MFTKLLERGPRLLSSLGLLGLLGLAGIVNPPLFVLSTLSFLSYLCYFRFFRWFVKPQPPITTAGILVPLAGILVWILSQVLYPELLVTAPMFGFIGFAGFLGLYESADEVREKTAV